MKMKRWLFLSAPLGFAMTVLMMIPIVMAQGEESAPRVVLGTTRYVATDGLCNGNTPCYDHIQTAVNAATDGDEIFIDSGIYTENVVISTDLTLQGVDALSVTIDGNMDNTVVVIASNTAVTLTNITLANGSNDIYCGSGLSNYGTTQLTNMIIRDNVTGCAGGGVANEGTIHISNTLIMSNTSSLGGGGLYNGETGTAIINQSTIRHNIDAGIFNAGTLTVNNSTLNNNEPTFSGSLEGTTGIYNHDGTLTINNSTFSEDSLGMVNGAVTVTNSTLNGLIFYDKGMVALHNTIVKGCMAHSEAGEIISLGHNLGFDSSCGLTEAGDIQNTNLMLAPLQDNGGPTETHMLLWGSPAINAGDNDTCTNAPINGLDQRGIARPFLEQCDIGAVELDLVLDQTTFLPLIVKN